MSIEELEGSVEDKLKQAKSISHKKSNLTITPELVFDSLHSKTGNTRHIYFSGLPLDLCKQVLNVKLEVKERDSIIADLNNQLIDSQKHVQNLTNNIQENFLKYEIAIGSAMKMGFACSIISNTIQHRIEAQKRYFMTQLLNNFEMEIKGELEDVQNLNKIYAVKLASAKLEILILRRN